MRSANSLAPKPIGDRECADPWQAGTDGRFSPLLKGSGLLKAICGGHFDGIALQTFKPLEIFMKKAFVGTVVAALLATVAGTALADTGLKTSWIESKETSGPSISMVTFTNVGTANLCVDLSIISGTAKEGFKDGSGETQVLAVKDMQPGGIVGVDLTKPKRIMHPGKYTAFAKSYACEAGKTKANTIVIHSSAGKEFEVKGLCFDKTIGQFMSIYDMTRYELEEAGCLNLIEKE